jgi:hypothetical protein
VLLAATLLPGRAAPPDPFTPCRSGPGIAGSAPLGAEVTLDLGDWSEG